MAFRLNTRLKSEYINQIIKSLAGTWGGGGTAKLSIYTGSMPADADTDPTGTSATVLCPFVNVAWSSCADGTSTLTAPITGTVAISGTAGWARLETISAAGTFRIDGDVGTGATNAFVITVPALVASTVITVLTAPLGAGTDA